MSARRCPDCWRLYASDADWRANAAAEDCPAWADCPWGADRCWYEVGRCGTDPVADADFMVAGAALRAGRPLARTPHPNRTEETR